MALYVTVKGLNVLLKIIGCYSREERGIFRNNILTYDILPRGVLQTQSLIKENAIVVKNDYNQCSILDI